MQLLAKFKQIMYMGFRATFYLLISQQLIQFLSGTQFLSLSHARCHGSVYFLYFIAELQIHHLSSLIKLAHRLFTNFLICHSDVFFILAMSTFAMPIHFMVATHLNFSMNYILFA